MTASFGVAALAQSRSVEDSIDRADKAMYEAKTTGRNRVVAEAQPPAAGDALARPF
ncbi:MAG: diguanylate cyclase [Sulfuritalea sp.]|nr:diguanylate cyclase [Sulfuritalea sp.]